VKARPSSPADHTWTAEEVEIDLHVAPPSRVSTYAGGGDAHFAVDREVAARMFAATPGGVDGFRAVQGSGQAFMQRVVSYLTTDAGIRQFLVTGCNVSGEPNVHDVAQAIAPECRVAYVVLDPTMLALAHTLRPSTVDGATGYVQAKLRDTGEILRQAAATLDLERPVAVLIPVTLPFVRRDDTVHRIVTGLMDGVGPGSHLMVSHHASDLFVEEHAEMYRVVARLARAGKTLELTPRSHAEVAKLFDGLELLDPGIVPIDEWRTSPDPAAAARGAIYGALARKP
jgi:S-adenosyl methyltransferase